MLAPSMSARGSPLSASNSGVTNHAFGPEKPDEYV